MTAIDQIRAMPDTMITAEVAAKVLPFCAQSIRVAARTKPELLGFSVCVVGHTVMIPRKPFLDWLLGKEPENK